MSVLVLAAVLVIVALGCVAIYYNWKLWQRKKALREAEQQLQSKIEEYRRDHIRSVRVISQAYISGQVELAEACIRLSKLMDMLEWQGEVREPYRVIDKMAESIAHIPTLERWKTLPKVERRKFEAFIASQELSFEPFVKPAVELLSKKAAI